MKLQIYCVGLGGQLKDHLLKPILDAEDADLIAVCDKDPCRLKVWHAKLDGSKPADVAEHGSFEDLIARARGRAKQGPTLCVISTPATTHAGLARRCLEEGFHVYVDKPFTLSLADGKELVELAEGKDLGLVVGSQRRFESVYEGIRDQSKNLGAITKLHFHNHGNFPNNDGSTLESNILVGAGYHVIDTIAWLAASLTQGSPKIKIQGATLQRWPHNKKYYRSFHALGLCYGAERPFVVSFASSSLPPPMTVDELLVITGERGEVRLRRLQAPRSLAAGKLTFAHWEGDDVVLDYLNPQGGTADRAAPLIGLISWVAKGRRAELRSTGADALTTLRMIDQISAQGVRVD